MWECPKCHELQDRSFEICWNCGTSVEGIEDQTFVAVAETPRVGDREEQLLHAIANAFRGIHLGDGVSLHEAEVLDNHGSPEERRTAREADEKHDWRRLIDDPELLRLGGVALSFYDAAGLRFHLPAYLSLVLRNRDREDAGVILENLMFTLTHLNQYNLDRLSMLDDAQRQCILGVLDYLRDSCGPADAQLDRAIHQYWSKRQA